MHDGTVTQSFLLFRRKKKCIRYKDGNETAFESEDNMGSAGSVEAPTPDSKTEDTDSQDTADTPHPHSIASPLPLQLSPAPSDIDTKPRLDSNGMVVHQPPRQPPPSKNHLYSHHPLSVHQLTQPHFSRSSLNMSRFHQNLAESGSGRPPPAPMLTVT